MQLRWRVFFSCGCVIVVQENRRSTGQSPKSLSNFLLFEVKNAKFSLRFYENCNYSMQVRNESLLSFMHVFIRKGLLMQQIIIILGGCLAQLVEKHRVSYREVAASIPLLVINVNYLTGTLCGVED